ncbi:UDP-3-O-acyl-N-acetylglucosamine deacetylase [Elusimicrobiota bacterium]
MDKQKTIAKEVSVEGVGLHTGNKSKLTFKPAPEHYGIKFVREDLPGKPLIPASYHHVTGTAIRGTTIVKDIDRVHTVEHILAVCSGLNIDNLKVHITNNEPPIMDGSAKPFAQTLLKTGIVEQNAQREYITLTDTIKYESGNTKFIAYPDDEFSLECMVSYDHPFVSYQKAGFKITPETFLKEIAPARTFCFDYEIEALQNKGLAKGGDLNNAIVVGLDGIHNTEPLRFPDEFVRHKMLDLIGDLYLIGKPLKARIIAERCGHNHNIEFAKELAKVNKIAV